MLIFATIFGVGFVLLVLSMIFGGDGDVDAGDGFDAHGGLDAHGPSIFSLKMVALIMVGFGALSFGVRATTSAGMLLSTLAGIGGAILVGGVGYGIIRAFYASQATSTITDRDIIGATGNLIDGIAAGGHGQFACIVQGREITYLARSADGAPLERGTPVRVLTKTGNTVTVEALSDQQTA